MMAHGEKGATAVLFAVDGNGIVRLRLATPDGIEDLGAVVEDSGHWRLMGRPGCISGGAYCDAQTALAELIRGRARQIIRGIYVSLPATPGTTSGD